MSTSSGRSARSAALFARAQHALPGGNTRLSLFYAPHPVYAVSGQGFCIMDADGVERIDCVNNMTSLIHGHGHPDVVRAVQQAAAKLMSAGAPTEAEIEMAEELCRRVPSVKKVRFAASGTEAVMFAIRAARAFTGRDAVAKAEGLYHGASDEMITGVSPQPGNWGPSEAPNTLRDTLGLPTRVENDVLVLPFNDSANAVKLIEQNAHRLAAVLVDPLPSRLYYTQASRTYMADLRAVTRKHGIMLICDEVMSFRLGYQGSQGVWGIEPDLSAFGKVIGGGLPLAAIGGSDEVMEVFNHLTGRNFVVHSGTYFANPVAVAAGLATLKHWDPAAIARLNGLGDRLRAGLSAALRTCNVPGLVQGYGSLSSLTLGDGGGPIRDYRDRIGRKTDAAMNKKFHRLMLDRGVMIVDGGSLILSTPMDEAVIDRIVDTAAGCLKELA